MPSREAVTRSMTSFACEPDRLLIGRDIRQLGSVRNFSTSFVGPRIQLIAFGIFQRVLILRAADAIFDRQILHRLHVKRDAVDFASSGCKRRITSVALIFRSFERLEIDQHASAVQRCVRAVDADERRKTLDRGIFQNDIAPSACCFSAIAGKEMVCGASEMP